MNSTRRTFLKLSVSLAGAGAGFGVLAGKSAAAARLSRGRIPTPASVRKGDMLYRTLGSTGEQVSLIGLGGHHIGRPSDEQESIGLVRRAIDHGITFMDNSWDYHDGAARFAWARPSRTGIGRRSF